MPVPAPISKTDASLDSGFMNVHSSWEIFLGYIIEPKYLKKNPK